MTGTVGYAPVTIAASGTVSTAIDVASKSVVGIFVGTMTGTALTFQASRDGTTFVPIDTGAGAYSITIADDEMYVLNPANFHGAKEIKVVSGSSEGAERTLYVALRDL